MAAPEPSPFSLQAATPVPKGRAGPLGVVLLQMGGPVDLDAVEPFLRNLFSDNDIIQFPRFMRRWQPRLAKRIARRRSVHIRERYRDIGGGSPIVKTTVALERTLEGQLKARGIDACVVTAMRYCEPSAATAVRRLQEAGVSEVLLVTLYPHFSRSTTGSSVKDFHLARKALGLNVPVRLIPDWGEDEGYLRLTERDIRAALARVPADVLPKVHLVFSAHGIPQRYERGGDPYGDQVRRSYELLAPRFPGLAGTHLCFQSKVGPLPWLKPYTDEHIAALAKQGAEAVVVIPLGFVSDHIETLYDMDMNFKEVARKTGIAYYDRAATFNADPAFGEVLVALIERRIAKPVVV